jgi:hypothetical protein
MSTTMHAFVMGVSLAINSEGLQNVLTWKPEAESNLFNERRTDGSSSTTSTVAGLIVPTTFVARTFDLALLDARSGRAAAFILAKLVTILIFGFFSDSCRCSALHLDSGCLLFSLLQTCDLTQLDQSPIRPQDSAPNRSGPALTNGACSKSPRFLSFPRQVGGLDCSRDEKESFEGHPQLAKAALTEDECVEFKHFVADGDGQCRRCGGFRKSVWFKSEKRANQSDRRFGQCFDRFELRFDRWE